MQGNTLAPYLFIIAVDYAGRTAISNSADCGFTLEKAKSRRHPAKCITDVDYADNVSLLSDFVDKAEKILHNVEMAAKLISLHVNEKKTEYMTFNQKSSKLTTINKKLTKDFLYLGSWINSNEKDSVKFGLHYKNFILSGIQIFQFFCRCISCVPIACNHHNK